MAVKTVEELRQELKEMCEKTNTSITGMEYLIKYYMNTLHWNEADSINYAIDLFKDGSIQQIQFIGKGGEIL